MARERMNVVTFEVASPAQVKERMKATLRSGKPDESAFISFPTAEALWKTLTPKRWDILHHIGGAGPLALREIARRVNRDVKAVHTDVHALLNAGVLDRTEDGRIEFPYATIRVDFEVHAAA